jgi:regulator of replication initiation timing
MSKEINDLKQQIMWLQSQNAFLTNKQEALRDHFAGLAMQTLPKDIPDMETLARLSYNMADAMLKERERRDV